MNKYIRLSSLLWISSMIILINLLSSCNKEVDNKINFSAPDDNKVYGVKSYRVAYIVLDGAVGVAVGKEANDFNKMPFLASMTNKSLFSWNSIAEDNAQDITYYADLLTGVRKDKHKVLSNNLSNANLQQYPLITDRLKNQLGSRTAVISANDDVKTLFENSNVDNKQFVVNDDEVVSAAKEELSKTESKFTLITLKHIEDVAKVSGYGPDNAEYVAALSKVDDHIKNIVNTIESRENYKDENWLVVVTSNRGGDYQIDPYLDDKSSYSIPKRNNFVLFYNKDFNYKVVQKLDLSDPSFDGSSVRFTGTSSTSAKFSGDVTKSQKYNIGNASTKKELTIQVKLKVNTRGVNNPTIVSKTDIAGNGTVGWSLIYNGTSGWRLKIQTAEVTDPDPLELDQWNTLTAKIYDNNGTRTVKLFKNGVLKRQGTIAASSDGNSPVPFIIGNTTNYGTIGSHEVVDVRIFDIALPDEYIASKYCSTAMYDNDPYWKNLLGYWPATEGTDKVFHDLTDHKNHLVLSNGTAAWNSFSVRSGTLCPTEPQFLDLSTIRSLDAPLMIYNWLGLLGVENYNLDSKEWSPKYSKD